MNDDLFWDIVDQYDKGEITYNKACRMIRKACHGDRDTADLYLSTLDRYCFEKSLEK